MDNILRRPLFRGGRVEKRGGGITSVLGYANGGQVTPKRGLVNEPGGYAGVVPMTPTGGQLLQQTGAIRPQTLEQYRTQQQIATKPVLSLGEIDQQYRDYLQKLQSLEEQELDNLNMQSPEDLMLFEDKQRRLSEELNFLSTPEGEKEFKTPLLKKREDLNLQRQKAGLEPVISREEQEAIQKKKIEDAEASVIQNAEAQTNQSEFEQIFNEYLPIFQKNLGDDPDEATRQRFLELAKFGTNLLAQGGGKRSTLEKIGAAAIPSIEGLSQIAKEEAKAKKYPKALALEAALKKVGDKKMTATEMSIVNDTIKSYAGALPFSPEENIKIAEEIVYNKKKLKDFKEHPGDVLTGQEQKGQYYYFKKTPSGLSKIGKWDGKRFIEPGEKGF
jgi:hypothetical protein